MGTFVSSDGVELGYAELGEGRPLVLLHGFTASHRMLVEVGLAPALADAGFHVVLPDLRGHGANASARSFPADVLVDDGLALVAALGLDDYDLAGYSLGGRVVVRMLVRGARPRRAIVGGQGLAEVTKAEQTSPGTREQLNAMVEGTRFTSGSAEETSARWIRHFGGDPAALLAVAGSLVPTSAADLASVPTPTLVVLGDDDERSTGPDLAAALPHATFATVPGDHVTALFSPDFAARTIAFLTG